MNTKTTISNADILALKYDEVADVFENTLGKVGAIEFLGLVMSRLSKKRSSELNEVESQKPSQLRKHIEPPPSPLSNYFENDDVDDMSVVLSVLVPNDKRMLAAVIGPTGCHVNEIHDITKCKVQVDLLRPGNFRHIFFLGTCKSAAQALQLVVNRMETKVVDVGKIIMVIPNQIVSHIIGKAGKFIKTVTSKTSTHIDIQAEQDLQISSELEYGRHLTIQGTPSNRMHACYILLRLLAADPDLPEDWKGKGALTTPNPIHKSIFPGPPTMNYLPGPPAGYDNNTSAVAGTALASTTFSLTIPGACTHRIIGTKGIIIQQIQKQTLCTIQVDKVDGVDGRRTVNITGPSVRIASCVSMINSMVQDSTISNSAVYPSTTPNVPPPMYSMSFAQPSSQGVAGWTPMQPHVAPPPSFPPASHAMSHQHQPQGQGGIIGSNQFGRKHERK